VWEHHGVQGRLHGRGRFDWFSQLRQVARRIAGSRRRPAAITDEFPTWAMFIA
jgi:hypothetical protein